MSNFDGTWNNSGQENFVDMMIKLGIPEQRAKFVGASRPRLTFKLTPDKSGFHFKHELPAMEEIITENTWTFGTPQEDVDENGKKGTTCWKLVDDSVMEGEFRNEDVAIPTIIRREIMADGRLKQEIRIGEIVGIRYFTRQ